MRNSLLRPLALIVAFPLAVAIGVSKTQEARSNVHASVAIAVPKLDATPFGHAMADGVEGSYDALMVAYEDRVLPISVPLLNMNSGQEAVFQITLDGDVDPADQKAIAMFFRCRRTHRRKRIAKKTLAMLADLAHHYPGKSIDVISGYRSPPYGHRHSKHFIGRAIDLKVRDVKLKDVRNYLWLRHESVGIGYYPYQGFIHMDSRPGEKDIAWTAPRRGPNNHYRPYWARKLRLDAKRAGQLD